MYGIGGYYVPIEEPQQTFVIGLDLGQSKDYTALVILEHVTSGVDERFLAHKIERFQLGTPYPTIVSEITKLVKQPIFRRSFTTLAVDQTGCGAPIFDLFKQANLPCNLTGIHITAGSQVNHTNGLVYVPKRELVSSTQLALQTGILKISKSLPNAEILIQELLNFQVKISESANDLYGAWRENQHDDLVLALSMALWVGTYQNSIRVTDEERKLVAQLANWRGI
jgi:hypothetical protein